MRVIAPNYGRHSHRQIREGKVIDCTLTWCDGLCTSMTHWAILGGISHQFLQFLMPERPVIRGQTKYSPLVLQVGGSCCLAGGLFSQRLWLRTLIVLLSRGGHPGSTSPAYNHEFYN